MVHGATDVTVSAIRTTVSDNGYAAGTRATVVRHTEFRRQIEFQHRNPYLEARYLRQYDAGATRRMELIVWTVDGVGALQVIQTRCVRRERMPWTLQFTVASATKPELAQLFVFRIQVALCVDELHFNLREGNLAFE